MKFAGEETIVALATPPGVGAFAVIRLSGKGSIQVVNEVFPAKDLTQVEANTIHFGTLRDGDRIVDEVLLSVFKAPHSFTKEDSIEISSHGSPYIVKEIMQLLIRHGARPASAGEFTKRAFMNGRFDLAQAEAVADLIHADSEASHRAALNQLRGGFSQQIKELRSQLVHFASMVELELDFGEEDVEFADRDDLKKLVEDLLAVIIKLRDSFSMGNAIKEGIPTVIAGKPNAGKSTLLNALLNEERAIVSDIAGTTRDVIEDELILEGIKFRFIDTAGLRETEDTIEKIGVERTRENIEKAGLVLFLYDVNDMLSDKAALEEELNLIKAQDVPYLVIGNKIDTEAGALALTDDTLFLSASTKEGIEGLQQTLLEKVELGDFNRADTLVTNARHYGSLVNTAEALQRVLDGLGAGITGDFLAMDIRQSLHHLGEITGEITTDDLLDNIFSKFCIGK